MRILLPLVMYSFTYYNRLGEVVGVGTNGRMFAMGMTKQTKLGRRDSQQMIMINTRNVAMAIGAGMVLVSHLYIYKVDDKAVAPKKLDAISPDAHNLDKVIDILN